MNISSRDLELFLALVEEKNFTRAAERCNISQSAFSTRISVLESALGARLFDRTTRSVELTPEGQLFSQSARPLFDEFSDVIENFRDHAARRKGRIAVAALPSLCASWLPRIYADFGRRYPGVDLTMTDTLSDPCLALLRTGHVDFALASSVAPAEDLDAELLHDDPFYLVCRHDHPLATHDSLQLSDIGNHQFLHLHRLSSVRQCLEAALHPATLRYTIEVEHLATLAGLVEAGAGVTVVPSLTLFQFRRPDLVVRPIGDASLSRAIYLVRRRGRSLSIAARALCEEILARRGELSVKTE
jgi:LysR family carnitine catabolism transcriptional activator